MVGREPEGGGSVERGGGWGGGVLTVSAVLSPHRHIMRRIMNSATLEWEGGPLSLKTSCALNGGGGGGGEGE